MKPTLDYKLAHAAGTDAGNRSMRKAGRESWNADDYDAACETTNRLVAGMNSFLCPECSAVVPLVLKMPSGVCGGCASCA